MKKKANTPVCLKKENNDGNLIDIGFEVSIFRRGELLENSKKESEEIQEVLRTDLKMSQRSIIDMTKIMIDEEWTQERFMQAYKHVLKNCTFYPPKTSEFLSYDKRVKFNTYYEICEKISEYIAIYYNSIKQPLYILKTEQEICNFKLWDEKYRKKEKKYYTDPKTNETYEV